MMLPKITPLVALKMHTPAFRDLFSKPDAEIDLERFIRLVAWTLDPNPGRPGTCSECKEVVDFVDYNVQGTGLVECGSQCPKCGQEYPWCMYEPTHKKASTIIIASSANSHDRPQVTVTTDSGLTYTD